MLLKHPTTPKLILRIYLGGITDCQIRKLKSVEVFQRNNYVFVFNYLKEGIVNFGTWFTNWLSITQRSKLDILRIRVSKTENE